MSGVLRATSADITTVNATDVNATSVDATPVKPGQIIEYITSLCDGSVVETSQGDILVENVSTQQGTSTTYNNLNGSVITYQPPPQATKVLYRFQWTDYWSTGDHVIHHYMFYIGGNHVTNANFTHGGRYVEDLVTFEWPIIIGIDNIADGKLLSWDSPVELKLLQRRYSNSHWLDKHGTHYWNGGGGNQFHRPTITLIAIA